MPSDPSLQLSPLTTPTPPENLKWAGRSAGSQGRGGAPPRRQRLSGCSAPRLPSPLAGPPGLRAASLRPPVPVAPPIPHRGVPPRHRRPGSRGHPGGREAADLEETGRAGPQAPAASIWPLRPALTREVAPGPRRRRPFVSGAAWRRAPCSPAPPPAPASYGGPARETRPGPGGVGSSTCAPDPSLAFASVPALASHPCVTRILDHLRPSGNGGHQGAHGTAQSSCCPPP